MESLHQKVESWIRDQRTKIFKVTWPQKWPLVINWPWTNGREQRKRIKEEYERRKKQLHDLCHAVKAESVPDLQDILCCMVLSECVYKRPDDELIRAVNKFKADFGSQVVSLERVQPSSDHVPHRYLLAEAGDTLFASFIGTKQYKDVMADANILQGAIFHEDAIEDPYGSGLAESAEVESQKENAGDLPKIHEAKSSAKPAAHRGFMARAKGIPALELYRLAQKKKRKLVLCGHSLGGAVAVLATLAILRVIPASSSSKEYDKVQVKCITFSQPPVGNAALRDYVNRKGWQHYFKTYCIPEDLVPRILSPAYFHHYNAQPLPVPVDDVRTSSFSMLKREDKLDKRIAEKLNENEEQLVLGLGPIQSSFWRLSRLVPLEAVKRQINKYKGKQADPLGISSTSDPDVTSSVEDVVAAPQSLEIEEGSDSISLKPICGTDKRPQGDNRNDKLSGKTNTTVGDNGAWRRMPYLPSYVPFGQLYLLGSSSVESLSGAEYSKLTSVRSVISELRERLQSHSMRSYRSRFQRIYDVCMNDDNASTFLGMDQLQQFPQLQKWLGISVAGTVELGHIVESPVIRIATSVAPLGWNGVPGEKNAEPLKVDISGIGLHLCTLVQARVNGNWCSTTVESFPSEPTCTSNHHELQPDIQNIRVLVGSPMKRPPKHQMLTESLLSGFPSIDSSVDLGSERNIRAFHAGKFIRPEGLSDFVVFCTTDFSTIFKEVHVRTRRVQLVGLEGSGKTSLLKAILGKGRLTASTDDDDLPMDFDVQEGISGGLCYSDSAGVNLQDLNKEVSCFRDELWMGVRDLSRKTDLIVLVHNLSHRIPRYSRTNAPEQPALSLLLDEAKALGIPWILAITNKYSVSAHQQKAAIDAILQAYQASPNTTEVINSCPYVIPSVASATPLLSSEIDSDGKKGTHKLIFSPMNLVRRPFQKKTPILPVEGVTALCQLVHRVLRNNEEAALQDFARDRLLLESAREHAVAADAIREAQAKANSLTAAAVGASVGAGIGIVMAVVMGAASALRKP